MASYLFFIFLFACIFPSRNCNEVNFTIPIIHRNSPLSPYYNPNMTIFDWIKSDKIRLDSTARSGDVSFQAHSSYLSGAYLMEIHIGSTHEKRHVFFDTGSDIAWIQCQPCNDCNFKTVPPLSALASNTYKPLTCKNQLCRKDKRLHCTYNNICGFSIAYFDDGRVDGEMALDNLHVLTTTGENYHQISNFIFGCAHQERTKHTEFDGGGLIGLGLGPLSFISQLSIKKFSHCLPPPPAEDTEKYQQIAFGHMAINPGQRTPLVADPEFFVIRLEGISFCSMRLPLQFPDPTPDGYFRMKLDSGTMGIWLHPNAYDPL